MRKDNLRARLCALNRKTHDQRGFYRLKVVWAVRWLVLVKHSKIVNQLICKDIHIGLYLNRLV